MANQRQRAHKFHRRAHHNTGPLKPMQAPVVEQPKDPWIVRFFKLFRRVDPV